MHHCDSNCGQMTGTHRRSILHAAKPSQMQYPKFIDLSNNKIINPVESHQVRRPPCGASYSETPASMCIMRQTRCASKPQWRRPCFRLVPGRSRTPEKKFNFYCRWRAPPTQIPGNSRPQGSLIDI